MKKIDYKKILFYVLAITAVIRLFIAANIELGNDEVYYVLYAMFPDWSHFDHPSMVGFTIQLFSLNLLFDHELFIRLGAIVFSTLNIYLIYSIVKKSVNPRAGIIASLLYVSSLYTFIISGTFILPDSPQVFFWLLAVKLLLDILPQKDITGEYKTKMLWFGIVVGFAMISKYTSVFLWSGAGLYILFCNREWLKKRELYFAVILSLIIFSPVFIWNWQNDFISFTFHSERVEVANKGLRLDYFFIEVLGQLLYNNPIVVVLTAMAVIAFFKGKKFFNREQGRVILFISLPLIVLFLGFSLFRRTLPHWTGPGYMTLMILVAAFIDNKWQKNIIPKVMNYSVLLVLVVIIVGLTHIKTGWADFIFEDYKKSEMLGEDDVSLDMYGWKQAQEKFQSIYESDTATGRMDNKAVIISRKWFPAADLDYYFGREMGIDVFAVNNLKEIHKYYWINKARGDLYLGMDAYYITTSIHFRLPQHFYGEYFEEIEKPVVIPIYRGGKVVKNIFVFRMKNLKVIPDYIHFE